MNLVLRENALSADIYNFMRSSVGWREAMPQQIETALKNSIYTLAIFSGDEPIAMGRLVGDGAIIWYIQDVIVQPKYQGMGYGKEIVDNLLKYVKQHSLPGTYVSVGLMAAQGKDGFYEKLGFRSRPNDIEGAGMIMRLNI